MDEEIRYERDERKRADALQAFRAESDHRATEVDVARGEAVRERAAFEASLEAASRRCEEARTDLALREFLEKGLRLSEAAEAVTAHRSANPK